MIQSGAQAAPLKGRLTTLTAEVAALEGRIGALKTEVGTAAGAAAGDVAAAEAVAFVEQGTSTSSSRYASYAALLSGTGSLKATVADLETRMGVVNSDIQQLQNQVKGRVASLLESDSHLKSESAGSSLESRTIALEENVANAKTAVTNIEQVVVG